MLTFKHIGLVVLSVTLVSSVALAKRPTKAELAAFEAQKSQSRQLERSFASRRFSEAHRVQWMNGIDGHCGELVNGIMVKRNPATCRGWHPPRLELRNGDCVEIAQGEIVVGSQPQAVCAANFAAPFRWEGADCAQWIDGVRRGLTPELERCRQAFPTTYIPDHEFCLEVTSGGAFVGYSSRGCGSVALNDGRAPDIASPACTADLRDAKFIAPPLQSSDGTREARGSTNVPL